jgi:uncharacterized protein involved in response to NO
MIEATNRGAILAELRRRRMAETPAFLRGGFRPFFLGAAAWALMALFLWIATLSGWATLPIAVDPLAWHRHEMLFGFIGAAIAGFLLTAIPNWTGRLPIAGRPLALFFAVWVGARFALLFSAFVGVTMAAILDVGFFMLLAALAGREVLATKNRNIPIIALILLFGAADAADYLAMAGMPVPGGVGIRAGLSLVVLLISLIGGRIIPSFTRNWLSKQGMAKGLPGQPDRLDLAVIAVTGVALIGWVAAPNARAAGTLLIAAGMLQALRLARWQGWRAVREPLVLILHIGYLWLPVGLLLLGASTVGTIVPSAAAIHALTAGAMASTILAVMTRATLGHTGHPLTANAPTIIIYSLVTLGALLRVVAPFALLDYGLSLRLSAAAWGGAFALFLLAYGAVLVRPHAGDPLQ